jgi:hypothetical protein
LQPEIPVALDDVSEEVVERAEDQTGFGVTTLAELLHLVFVALGAVFWGDDNADRPPVVFHGVRI